MTCLTLALTGVLTAVSGTLIASQIGSGTGTTATGMELDVIGAVIIRGTSLLGGKGRIWGTFVGIIFLGCFSNGMTLSWRRPTEPDAGTQPIGDQR